MAAFKERSWRIWHVAAGDRANLRLPVRGRRAEVVVVGRRPMAVTPLGHALGERRGRRAVDGDLGAREVGERAGGVGGGLEERRLDAAEPATLFVRQGIGEGHELADQVAIRAVPLDDGPELLSGPVGRGLRRAGRAEGVVGSGDLFDRRQHVGKVDAAALTDGAGRGAVVDVIGHVGLPVRCSPELSFRAPTGCGASVQDPATCRDPDELVWVRAAWHVYSRMGGALRTALLVAWIAAPQAGAAPASAYSALILKVLRYDRAFPTDTKKATLLLVHNGTFEKDCEGLGTALTQAGVHTQPISLKDLDSAADGAAALYVCSGADVGRASAVAEKRGLLSFSGDDHAVKSGVVSIGFEVDAELLPKIVVNVTRLKVEGHDLDSSMLAVVKTVRDVAGAASNPGGVAAPSGPVEFNSSMTPAEFISGPSPKYTRQALENKIAGEMIVKCVITVAARCATAACSRACPT